MTETQTFRALIESGRADVNSTVRQYADRLNLMIRRFAAVPDAFLRLPVDLDLYLSIAPKFSKKNPSLLRKIADVKISPATYKQYQKCGRLMIDTYTGALAARRELLERDDTFKILKARMKELADAHFIDQEQLGRISRLVSVARAQGLDLPDLNRETIIGLRDYCETSPEWTKVKSGAAFIDETLRKFPTLSDILPAEEFGNFVGVLRSDPVIPDHLQEEAEDWIAKATTKVPDLQTEAARQLATTTYANGTCGIYQAGLKKYVHAAADHCALNAINGLTPLFTNEMMENTIVSLLEDSRKPTGVAFRTLYSYLDKVVSRQHLWDI